MRINEILIESQQLDEGPFGQAVGKAVGGVAKGVGAVAGGIAGIPGAVKKGFKAGKAAVSGDPAADTTQAAPDAAAPTAAAPAAKKPGLLQKIGKAATDFAQGYQQGTGQAPATTAPAAATTTAPAATAAPASTAPVPDTTAAPAADPAAEKQSKIGVGQINKIIPTLRTRDLMSLQTNLEKAIAGKKKAAPAAAAPAAKPAAAPTGPNWDEETGAPLSAKAKAEYQTFSPEQKAEIQKNIKNKSKPSAKQNVAATQAEIDADRDRLLPQNSSVVRTGRMVAEGFSLYRKY
jgi:hypothetical protein